ncbi:MAG: flippase [Candidatus Bathyarchaeota archaeon]|nr:flippase [Candidatus Bathyarchaeota archaeon]
MDENIEDLVKTTTRGSLILLIGQISSTFILAFGMLVVARILGPVSYGSFNKAQSVVQIAVLLMNLGVQQAMIKYLAQYRHEKKTENLRVFIESGLLINTVTSISLTLLVYFSAGYIANNIFNEPEQEMFIKYLSLSIVGSGFSTLAQGITIGYERMELRSMISLAYSFVKSVISPILVYIGLGALGAVLGHSAPIILSGVLGLVFIFIIYRNEPIGGATISHKEAVKIILTYGFPLYLTSLLGGILPQFYTTMLGSWQTSKYTIIEINDIIGNYSVVLNFGVLLSFVTLPIGTTIFPLFSKLENNKKELNFLYRNAVKYSTLFGYLIIFTIIALADQIIYILFADKYIYAPHYLRIYMLSFLLIGFGSVCNGSLLSGQNRNDVNFKSTLAKFIVSLPLSYFAILNYGAIGLLYTYFVTASVNTLFNVYYIHRIFGFKFNTQFLLKMIVISVFSCFVVYGFVTFLVLNQWIELFLGGLLSVFLYLVGVLILKALTKQDFAYLRRLSDSFGPISPVIRWFVDVLIRFT